MSTILHLDMDSYFASVEQQFNQKLVGKPVGVLKARGRTCVIAASREAKKCGVKTGTSVWEAKALCPPIIFVPADFSKYFNVTKKFVKICENFSPYLEVFSIDELFLDVTLTEPLFDGAKNITRLIKEKIRKEIGQFVTCSIGLSYNRLLAKLASGINKPDGFFEITPDNRDAVLFSVKLSDLCGLGPRLENKLHQMGITNFKTLRQIPLKYLKPIFGPFQSIQLKNFSYGEDNSNLIDLTNLAEAKSVSRTFTLFKNTRDETKIRQTLRNLCEEVGYKLRKMKTGARQIGLGIRGDSQGEYTHRTLKFHTDNSFEIFQIVWQLFKNLNWPNNVRFLGVWAGLLSKKQSLTLSLFPAVNKQEKLMTATDKINDKFGDFTVYPAILLGGELIRPEVNGYLGDKKYQFGL